MPDANDLSLDEWKAVIGLIRRTLDASKFPFSEEMRTLRAALAKLDPKPAAPTKPLLPPLPGGPMVGSRRKPRR